MRQMKQNWLLRLARREEGLTQEELAGLLGVCSMTIYRWERGESVPHRYFRERLCRLFQVSEHGLGWFLSDELEGRNRDDVSPFLVDPSLAANPSWPLGQHLLLKEIANSHRQIIGLTGVPGSGKTMVAQALASLPEIHQQVEGVLWASVGPQANPLRSLQRWYLLLGGQSLPERLEELQEWLRAKLGQRKMLIVLDDLWEAKDFFPYHLSPQCRYVLTTRLPALADTLCESVVFPRPLTERQAFHLLTHGLPSSLVREHHAVLRALSQQVGQLPQALSQIRVTLRREARAHSQRRFQEALTHLFHPSTYLHLDILSGSHALAASLKRSEAWLSPASRHAFLLLATHFPAAPATFSERQAVDLMRTSDSFQWQDLDQLIDGGLLSVVGRSRYQFHPVIVAYARLVASSSHEQQTGNGTMAEISSEGSQPP